MSHEVETMFYTSNEANGRFIPWHGLGTPVQEALTSKEALKVAGLDWKVSSEPVFTLDQTEISNVKANIRNTDRSVLGLVSDRYKIVQNDEAFDFTDSLIGDECRYETAGSLFNGKKIFLLAKMPQRLIVDDAVDPYICFTNSHDGSSAIRACMTPVRVVCNNTLNLALSSTKRQWSTRHMGNLSDKLNEAKMTLQLAHEYMDNLAIVGDQLANTKISEDATQKILEELFPVSPEDSERKKRNALESREQFTVCMFRPDILKFLGTKWGMIQAASDFATHVAPKRASATYQEKNFDRLLDGHIIIDTVFDKVLAAK